MRACGGGGLFCVFILKPSISVSVSEDLYFGGATF